MENKKRLIEVNVAIKEMNAVHIHPWDDAEDAVEKCVNLLHNSTTVDAEEVVRCKDCCSYAAGGWCDTLETSMEKHDFCSYGERRTDNA